MAELLKTVWCKNQLLQRCDGSSFSTAAVRNSGLGGTGCVMITIMSPNYENTDQLKTCSSQLYRKRIITCPDGRCQDAHLCCTESVMITSRNQWVKNDYERMPKLQKTISLILYRYIEATYSDKSDRNGPLCKTDLSIIKADYYKTMTVVSSAAPTNEQSPTGSISTTLLF